MKTQIILFLLVIINILNRSFCECSSTESIQKAYKTSDFIASGKVIKIEYINVPETEKGKIRTSNFPEEILSIYNGIPLAKITFKINETLKGMHKNERIIYTMIGGGSCGFSFTINKEYLIYAFKEEHLNNELKKYSKIFTNALHTNYCTRTKRISEIEVKKIKELMR